jgi:hypothetical protein
MHLDILPYIPESYTISRYIVPAGVGRYATDRVWVATLQILLKIKKTAVKSRYEYDAPARCVRWPVLALP